MEYIKKLYTGRIGRRNYFFGIWLYILILEIPVVIMGSIYSRSDVFSVNIETNVIGIIWFALLILSISSLIVRRLHDIGGGGFRALLLILVWPLLYIFLIFKEGDKTANKYGQPVVKEKFFISIFPKINR